MADILKLKKKAADFEAKKQADKALGVYVEIVNAYEAGEEDTIDIPFYNRVGDLLQKAGKLSDAVSIWEKAVDHYTEGGFYNPAIALCNKILRASPGRTVVYYKLGKISAEKGFKADARQNFLEYAARQQKAGNIDEAFRTLKEFADLVPDQYDVRLMLGDQLLKAGKKDEAIEQLQVGYAQATADGQTAEADAFVAKMKAIDPTVEPRADGSASSSGGAGLVFLDVDSGPSGRKSMRQPTPGDAKRLSKAVQGLALLDPVVEPPKPAAKPAARQSVPAAPAAPAARKSVPAAPAAPAAPAKPPAAPAKPAAPAAGGPRNPFIAAAKPPAAPPAPPAEPEELTIEPTHKGGAAAPPPRGSVAGLQATSFTDDVAPPAGDGLDLLEGEPPTVPSPVPDLGMVDLEPPSGPLVEPEPSLGSELELLDDSPMLGGDQPLIEMDAGVEPFEPPVETFLEMPAASTELVSSVDSLRTAVEASPEDWGLRRQFAEALLEAGERAEGIAELEATMAGYEKDGDLDTAGSIAEEIVRLEPKTIRFHRKRVEFAFRSNDRALLAEVYVELADALLADGQAQNARVVYQRVLDITPDDVRAQAAIESIPEEAPTEAPAPRRSTTAVPVKAAPKSSKSAKPAKSAPAAGDGDDDFVSLGDWLREDDEPKSTRMVVEEKEPTGDEQADFADMLRMFKQGVSDNVDDEDHEAHYDLGVAYKEMGLLDEAVAEFQKALRGTGARVRSYEALGHCFIEKQQLPVASTILQRALSEPDVRDESLVGVLYLLGWISEELKAYADAKRYYERVFAVDIQFRDIGDRLNAVDQSLA
jgi:tetratricopeptide (TPR) repeat protein